jgi:hypothetical protein
MPLHRIPARSNAERQRLFRERNPGYYARLKAAERASAKRGLVQIDAAMQQNAAVPADGPSPAPAVAPQDDWQAPLGC